MAINVDNHSKPCPTCGLKHQCICHHIPTVTTSWHVALLTHSNELSRDTNTGKLLIQSIPNSSVHVWDRRTPPAELLDLINSNQFVPVVLFPSEESIPLSAEHKESSLPLLFILLDGTWQEARKIFRKSPWLQSLNSIHLESDSVSQYKLRKNQKQGNLCTYEVGSEIIKFYFGKEKSNRFSDFFHYYLSVFNADKSGHKYINKIASTQ